MNVKQLSYQEGNDDSIKEFKQNRVPKEERKPTLNLSRRCPLSDDPKTKHRRKKT